ncbi:DNA gyrase inhibitor YacG [Psychromonas sp.]|uniref:DNA gyrase inhibitor YacG n=1 Tax=Psychromonas sp. TaxID=1884585 RepID=UPI00356B124E
MKVNCPTCKKEVEWIVENSHRPFCCKRCQLIDLGEWASEEKAIKGESITPEDMPRDKTIYFDS